MTWGRFDETENKALPTERAANPAHEIHPGDILLSRANTRAYVGAPVLVGQCRPKLLLSDKSLRLVPGDLVDKKWLVYLLGSPEVRRFISDAATGTKDAMRNISQQALLDIPLSLPPLAEQNRIVEALEGHLSRLDAAQADLRQSIGRLPALRGGMRNVVTRGHMPDVELPNGWHWGTLSDVLDRIEAGKSFRCEPRPATEDEWGVIKVSAMTWGEYRAGEQKAVPEGKDFDPRHEIKPGDILVSRANTPAYVGAPVLVRESRPRLLLSDKSLRLVPKSGVDRTWLIQALSSPYARNQISAKATGTKDSMRNISQRELSSIRVPIPPAETQALIGETLDNEVQRVDNLAMGLNVAQVRATHLRQALLNRAFSGQLVPQDPAEEPASVLLDRIRAEREAQGGKAKRGTRRPRKAADAAPPPAPASTPSPTTAVQQELPL